jgi:hypothetical protein
MGPPILTSLSMSETPASPLAGVSVFPVALRARWLPDRGYPLPMNGIPVAMTVRNWTLAWRGKPAM